MPKRMLVVVTTLCAVALLPATTLSEMVREEGVQSVAGVLVPEVQETAEWNFSSSGNEIIFASLDADIYLLGPQMGESSAASLSESGGSCGDSGGGGESGGSCGDSGGGGESGGSCGGGDSGSGCGCGGGPGLFYIEIIDSAGETICRAERPAPPPGWQHDPRTACLLPYSLGRQFSYVLRVGLNPPQQENIQTHYPFLLNISVRKVASVGVGLPQAVAESRSHGF